MFMSIGVEYGYVVNGIFEIGISSVVSLGVPSLITLSVTSHGIPGDVDSIPGAVSSVFLSVASVLSGRVYVGSAMYAPNKLRIKRYL